MDRDIASFIAIAAFMLVLAFGILFAVKGDDAAVFITYLAIALGIAVAIELFGKKQ